MDDLVQFLRARLDEDEAAAKAADSDEIEATPSLWGTKYLTLRGSHDDRHTTELPAELADHIARHDPDRILKQTAILRGRVDLWSKMVGSHASACLREFAAIWDEHPDYRPEWRL
ncbi:DUF6221 family protein [Streptomyces sp. NPDC059904]|uniref:DUF6221 family protein n=1 Tax=Streptomyces sp. NPDC059904 TaxID=3346996 RepID=UPI00364A0B2C